MYLILACASQYLCRVQQKCIHNLNEYISLKKTLRGIQA